MWTSSDFGPVAPEIVLLAGSVMSPPLPNVVARVVEVGTKFAPGFGEPGIRLKLTVVPSGADAQVVPSAVTWTVAVTVWAWSAGLSAESGLRTTRASS